MPAADETEARLSSAEVHMACGDLQGEEQEPDSQEVGREAWVDLKGDVEHALPLAQPKLLKGIQLYFAELDIQSMLCLPYEKIIDTKTTCVVCDTRSCL